MSDARRRRRSRYSDSHLPKVDDLLLLRLGIDLDHAKRRANTKSTIQDIDTKDDGVTLREGGDRLEAAGPDSLRGGISTLGFHNLRVVSGERVEQMVDDVSYVTY